MFGLIKEIFIELIASVVVNSSRHTKCVSLSNQKCEIQPTLIDLHPNEYSQELQYYLFAVKLDRFVGGCTTLNYLPNKVCIPNKTEDLDTHVFNTITGKIESKILRKDISCELECKFDRRKCNSNEKWYTDKY